MIAVNTPRIGRMALARWLSLLAHPFVTTTVMVAVMALHFGTPADAVRSVALVVAFGVVPLALLMYRQVRRGSWENVDASNARERPVLFTIALLGLVLLLTYLLLVHPRSFLVRGIYGGLGMVIVCAAVTRWVKVSLHVAYAALAATILLLARSPAGWAMAAVIPALMWSRLAMGRHRPLELLLGLLIGIATGMAIHYL